MSRCLRFALVTLVICASPSMADEMSAEQIRQLWEMEDDRSSVVAEMRLFPAAVEYEMVVAVTSAGEQPQVSPLIPVREKLVGGRYLMTKFRPPGVDEDFLMAVYHDPQVGCYRKYVLLPDGVVARSIGTRVAQSRTLSWVSVPSHAQQGELVLSQEQHGADGSTWRELIIREGRVVATIEGTATVTKRAPAP